MNQTHDNQQNPYAYSGGNQTDSTEEGLRQRPHTRWGVASTICGLLAWGLFAALTVMILSVMNSDIHPDELNEDGEFTRFVYIVGLMGISFITLNVTGAMLGIIGALRSNLDRRKLFAYVGLCLNVPLFLFFLTTFVLGIG